MGEATRDCGEVELVETGGPRPGRREQVTLAVVAGVALLVAGRLALRRPSGEVPLLLVAPTPQAILVHVARRAPAWRLSTATPRASTRPPSRSRSRPTFLADL